MPIDRGKFMSLWNLEDIHACNEGMMLAQIFLEASGECVSNLGLGRTSGTRFALLSTYYAMVKHTDECVKCNKEDPSNFKRLQM